MTVVELATQLMDLVRAGHGDSEVRLRASYGDQVQVRTGVDGIQHELRAHGLYGADETILLWGRTDP